MRLPVSIASPTGLQDLGLLGLRLFFGGTMLVAHGWGKLANFQDRLQSFSDPLGLGPATSLTLAVFAEVVCALLIVLGLGTRLAAAPLTITMLVAAFAVHAGDPFRERELAILYAYAFFSLLVTGPGCYSADARLRTGRRGRLEPPAP